MTILLKPIALTGLMGSGKSSVGKILKRQLDCKFIDTDEAIVNELGLSIPKIFEKFSERYFRRKEEELILNISLENSIIVATGGGAITSLKVRNFLRKNFFTIYLMSDIETLWARISLSKHNRPLINDDNGRQKLEKLLADRSQYYCQANLIIESTNRDTKRDIVKQILIELSKSSIVANKEI